jgi:molecular chaperone GrpE
MSESHEDLVVESDASDSTQETIVEGASSNAEVTIDDVLKERDEFKDIALRVQADFENYRKRAASQMGDELDRALGKLVEQLLPVLDACEAAVAHGVEGVEQVW